MPAGKLYKVFTTPKGNKKIGPVAIMRGSRRSKAASAGPARRVLGSRNILSQQMLAFPRGKRVLLKYATQLTLTTAASTGLPAFHRYNLNSLFDPDNTGVGHQPHFFDQLTPMYTRYRVDNCSYRVTVGGGTRDHWVSVLVASNTTFAPSAVAIDQSLEQRGNKWAKYSKDGPKCVIQGNVSLHKLMGLQKKAFMADDFQQSIVTASPLQPAILTVATQACDKTASDPIEFMVELWYDSHMFIPTAVGQS